MISTWLERIRDFRNRKIADPDFRRWAARFALTRPIARRQASALFDLTAGFVYSQVLSACVGIDLFEQLATGPLDAGAIAAATGLPGQAVERLLKAAAALDLVERRSGDRFALGPLGAALVNNAGVKAMIVHHGILYRDLCDPLSLLAGTSKPELGRYWSYAHGNRNADGTACAHRDYTALMAASQAFVAGEILDAYPLARHRRLLDVGGGDATFLLAAARSAPHLKLALFDLPPVAEIARRRIADAGLTDRAEAFGGSFFSDALPRGADVVTLNRVLHDHDEPAALVILRAVRAACDEATTLIVAEPMAGTRGARASGDAYFGFYLLAMGQGRPRTAPELGALLVQAGFDRIAPVTTATPLIARILTARPAA